MVHGFNRSRFAYVDKKVSVLEDDLKVFNGT